MQVQTVENQGAALWPLHPEGMDPTFLLLPGVNNSGPDHWQTHWEGLANFERVEMGNWSNPTLHEWVAALDRCIRESPRPVVLVAHSLGCLAVTWWAKLHWSEELRQTVAGALLVAPPDVDCLDTPEATRDFRPLPDTRLPFRSMLVASQDDPYASFSRSNEMARSWGADFVDAGRLGHINAESGVGEWTYGLRLLADFTGRNTNRLIAELSLKAAFA